VIKKSLRRTFAFFAFATLLVALPNLKALTAEPHASSLVLSPKEDAWLAAHSDISFTGDPNWLPFEAFDENGTYIGLVANYLATFEERLNIHFTKQVSTSWEDAVNMATSGKADVISDVLANETVSRTHIFTHAYLTSPLVVLSREVGSPIRDLNELGDSPIGIIKEYGYVWDLWDAYPQTNMVDVDTIQDGLTKLLDHRIDYLVVSQTIGQFHIAKAHHTNNLHIRGQLPINIELGLAVRKDWPELVSILNKAIASLSPQQRYQIAESWYFKNSSYFQDNRDLWRLAGLTFAVVIILLGWVVMVRLQHYRLTRREQRYAQALAAINAGEWELNKDNYTLHLSPVFLQHLGITSDRKKHTLNDLYDWITPEDQPNVINAFESLLTTPDIHVLDVQCRLKHSETDPVWLSIKGGIIHKSPRNNQGKLAGTIEDITELRRSSMELKQKDQLLASLFDAMPDLVSLKDLDRKYLFHNAAFQNFFSPRHSLLGQNDNLLLEPELSEEIACIEEQVILNAERKEYSSWASDAHGSPYYFDIIKTPLFDDSGNVTGVLSVSRDSTERYRLTQELEQFKLFAEYSEQGMGMAHIDAKLCYLNPTLSRWLLEDEQDNSYINRSFFDFYPAQYHTQLQHEILPAVINNGLWRGELELLKPDGSTTPTLETFFLIRGPDNEPLYIGDVVVDISAEKEAQQALEAAIKEADSANASKSTFLTNMSHEIRTPLNAVLGYSQLLMKEQDLGSERKEQVRRIHNAGQRLLNLINDVLDLSKIEAGKFIINQEKFNLTQELQDLTSLHQERAETKHLALITDFKLDKQEWVLTDKTKFGQVITNLISNAIKFTHQGEVRVTAYRDGKQIVITISDTGAGISDDELHQLFHPFVQGKSGHQNGGTGLGLVLSRHIIESLGGTLTMKSKIHQGTQIVLNLPLERQTMTQPKENQANFEHGLVLPADKSFTALVVEDDAMSRDLLIQFLSDTGFHVIIAEDGLAGLSIASQQKPDIIFTDIRMPEMDGITLLNKLKKHYNLARTPIVAVSASSLEHERRFYLQQGFSDFVGKPIDFNWLIAVIEQQLNTILVAPVGQPSATGALSYGIPSSSEDDTSNDLPTPSYQLTPEIMSQIKEAAHAGDFDTVANLCKQTVTSHHSPLSQAIQQALNQYDLEKVVELIDRL